MLAKDVSLMSKDVDDGFGHFRHQHPLPFNFSVGHQHSKDDINIEILSPIPKNCHQNLCSRTDRSQDLAIPDLLQNCKMMVEVRNQWTGTEL